MSNSSFDHLYIEPKAGVRIPRIMVAGGAIKTAEHVKKLARVPNFSGEWGSITTPMLPGNGGRDYYEHYEDGLGGSLEFALNSLGLPNPGMDYVEKHAKDLIMLWADNGKTLPINISGNGANDTIILLQRALRAGFRLITVNGACPNKVDQPILCYDKGAVDEVFYYTDNIIRETDAVILWKVSLGMPRPILAYNRACVANSKTFSGIITGNTIPNGLYYLKDGTSAVKTTNGITRGGVSGPAVRPIALDHTQFCAEGMPEGKIVLGCGGISTLSEVLQFIDGAGADGVQMQTAWRKEGGRPEFVIDLMTDLHDRRSN